MTHDPMCPYFPEQQGFGGIDSGVPSTQPYIPGVPCQCSLIARVREDTLAAVNLPEANATYQRVGYRTALRDAVEAVRALDLHRHYRISCEPPHPVDWSQHRWCDAEADAIAAIEALG